MPTNLKHFRVFCDVAATRSFSRGAALSRISQSAATQLVLKLERHYDTTLVDRSKRPLALSAAGQICYQGFREILDRAAAIEEQVRSQGEDIRGEVRVAAIYSVGLYAMNRCMQAFLRRYPQTKARLEFLPPARVYEAVVQQGVDLGLVSYPKAGRGLSVIPLRTEAMALVCNPAHRLARIRKVTVDHLRGEAFVGFDPGLIIRREIDRYLRRHEVEVDVVMEFDNIETMKQAVEIGAGVAILPEPTVRAELERGVLVAPLALADLRRPLGIIHRSRREFPPSVARFVELLRASQEEPPELAGH
jgi:DNA-binding transcriptional LysR family regulator